MYPNRCNANQQSQFYTVSGNVTWWTSILSRAHPADLLIPCEVLWDFLITLKKCFVANIKAALSRFYLLLNTVRYRSVWIMRKLNHVKVASYSKYTVKLLLKWDRRTPTDRVHKELLLLKIDDVHSAKVLFFFNECRSCRVPDMFVNYYKIRETGLNLGNRSSLNIPWARTDMGRSRCDIKVHVYGINIYKTPINYYVKRASTSNPSKLLFGPLWLIPNVTGVSINTMTTPRMYQVKYDTSLRTVL